MKTIGTLITLLLTLGTSALAACDNPFFPAVPGSSKTFAFKSKVDGHTGSYTIRVVNFTANGFTLRYEYTDPVRVLESPYTCTTEGLTSSSLFSSGFGPDAKVTTQVTKSSGLVIPAAPRWRVGSSWTFSNEGTLATDDKTQGKLVYTFKNEVVFRVVGEEQVKVPAGAFPAFKVVLSAKGEFGAGGKTQPITYTLTQWYARGVGLVRQEDQAGVHELTSYQP